MDLDAVRAGLRADVDRLRAPDGYLRAGHPRYHTLFGRDSLIAAWQTLDVDPSIAAATLRELARLQGQRVHPPAEEEPGKILHEHRADPASQAELPGWEFPYYGSVDSTPLFLMVLEEYRRRTEDLGLVRELQGAVVAAYRWMVDHGGLRDRGFLVYAQHNPQALFHQGWKDGERDHLAIALPVAIVEAQGYAYAALRATSSLAGGWGEATLAAEARDRAAALRKAFDDAFWMPGRTYIALGLDGEGHQRDAVTSNPGHLLGTGILSEERARAVAVRLFRDDMWTPYGLRTHAASEPDFDPYAYHLGTVWPHDNWMVYRGLRRLGFQREADAVREALLRAHEALGKIPELYAVADGELVDLSVDHPHGTRANPLQAWASAGLLDMLTE